MKRHARLLGCTAGSVKGRLERGRKLLHVALARRGLALSGAMLALEVSQTGSASGAARLAAETRSAVLAFVNGESGVITPKVLALTESAIGAATGAKVKVALRAVGFGGLGGWIEGYLGIRHWQQSHQTYRRRIENKQRPEAHRRRSLQTTKYQASISTAIRCLPARLLAWVRRGSGTSGMSSLWPTPRTVR